MLHLSLDGSTWGGVLKNRATTVPPRYRPELVFGVIGPAGADLGEVSTALAKELERYHYKSRIVRVSDLFSSTAGFGHLQEITHPRSLVDVEALMSAGDSLRRRTGRKDAAILMALGSIIDSHGDWQKEPRDTAWILNSLKTPEEADLLTVVYAGRCWLISVFSTRERRVEQIADELARQHGGAAGEPETADAERLVERDERGVSADPYGQNVGDSFPLGDYFVDIDRDDVKEQVQRFLRLVFADPFMTPLRDEELMFVAYGAALRSASLSRQVGAAISVGDGSIVAIGSNEVPRAGGGQYWAEDSNARGTDDGRQFRQGADQSQIAKEEMVRELLVSVQERLTSSVDSIMESLDRERLRIFDLLEFYREMHAEMAAVMDAARQGTSIRDGTLATTTFPCHDCAKHIIGAGIRRVLFIEPYVKSRAAAFHRDALVIGKERASDVVYQGDPVTFETYRGVAPKRYTDVFRMPQRKVAGTQVRWREGTAEPRTGLLGTRLTQDEVVEAERTGQWSAIVIREQVLGDRLPAIIGALEEANDDKG